MGNAQNLISIGVVFHDFYDLILIPKTPIDPPFISFLSATGPNL